jgi:glycosyltransferase involved in cell wall biosynthesis
MRIGIVFHKNPFLEPTGIDLVRLRAIAGGLIRKGMHAEIIAPVLQDGEIDGSIPVRRVEVLHDSCRYDIVKTSYHYSIELIREYSGPVVSRIVRVVDTELPERDEPFRARLLACQETIRNRASVLVLNNQENAERWHTLYGDRPHTELIPTGCPSELPSELRNPFSHDQPVLLFLGSLAAPRMVNMVNRAAELMAGRCKIHFIGANKACMYGGDESCMLNPLVMSHGELPEPLIWDYVRHASIGLALATGPHAFDNDVSKILNYLRGGLPVLSEDPIVNNRLVRDLEFGTTFNFDDVHDLVSKAENMLNYDFGPTRRNVVMHTMASEHSWDRRVESYIRLFRTLI